MTTQTALHNVMTAAARAAGRILIRDFNEIEHLQTGDTPPFAFVHSARKHAGGALQSALARARPDYGYFSPSTPRAGHQEFCWIVEPLDGERDFLHALPGFTLSLALERRGDVIAALVYAPFGDDLFFSEKGRGSFHNNSRLRVSARSRREHALLACAPGAQAWMPPANAGYQLRIGAAATLDFARLAAGKFDAALRDDITPWTRAPSELLIREAGGMIIHPPSRPKTSNTAILIAAPPTMERQILEIIRNA